MKIYNYLIVEDHHLMAKGLVDLLSTNPELNLLGIADNSLEALNLVRGVDDLLVIQDIDVNGENGFDIIQLIKNECREVRCIMYTMHDSLAIISKARDVGIQGYICKNEAFDELNKAVEIVLDGDIYYSTQTAHLMNKGKSNITRYLSKVEVRMINCVIEGKSLNSIIERCARSLSTIEFYKTSLLKKFACKDENELKVFLQDTKLLNQFKY